MKKCPKCGCTFYDNVLIRCIRCSAELIDVVSSDYVTDMLDWYTMLPSFMKIERDKIDRLEKLRLKYNLLQYKFFISIGTTIWALEKSQEETLAVLKKAMPNANDKELWKHVLLAKLNIKLAYPVKYFFRPVEIKKDIENIDSIVKNFESFEDVVLYIIEMDEKEHAFFDPTGLKDDINKILYDLK